MMTKDTKSVAPGVMLASCILFAIDCITEPFCLVNQARKRFDASVRRFFTYHGNERKQCKYSSWVSTTGLSDFGEGM